MGKERKQQNKCRTLFLLFPVSLLSIRRLSVTVHCFSRFVGIDMMYCSGNCHVFLQVAELETVPIWTQKTLATARGERSDRLWSSHLQALWRHLPRSDTTSFPM